MSEAQPNSVEFWAASRADIAFIEGDRNLTWKQLNDSANRVPAIARLTGMSRITAFARTSRAAQAMAIIIAAFFVRDLPIKPDASRHAAATPQSVR